MSLTNLTKYDIINSSIYVGQIILFLILLSYIILLLKSFTSSKVYQKHPENGSYFDFKPLSSIIYSIISFCFIVILILNLNVLGLFAISYIDNTSTFITSSANPKLENIIMSIIIIIPSFLILFSVIANFSRATFVIHEIDNGTLFSSNGKKNHNYKEGTLRFLIISLFLLIEFFVKVLSHSNIKQEPYKLELASLSRFFSLTESSFYESLFWIGILLFILYILLLSWLFLNKSIFHDNRHSKFQNYFYISGMIISFFLILLAYSVNTSNDIVFLLIFFLGSISIVISLLMLGFIVFDIYSNFKRIRWI